MTPHNSVSINSLGGTYTPAHTHTHIHAHTHKHTKQLLGHMQF